MDNIEKTALYKQRAMAACLPDGDKISIFVWDELNEFSTDNHLTVKQAKILRNDLDEAIKLAEKNAAKVM